MCVPAPAQGLPALVESTEAHPPTTLSAHTQTLSVQVAKEFFAQLAAAARRSADTGAGRRRLMSAGPLDLTSATVLSQLVSAAVAAAQRQLAQGALYSPDPAVLAVSM